MKTIRETGVLRRGGRSVQVDADTQTVWGVDEYGTDAVVADATQEGWEAKAVKWLLKPFHDRNHPKNFLW